MTSPRVCSGNLTEEGATIIDSTHDQPYLTARLATAIGVLLLLCALAAGSALAASTDREELREPLKQAVEKAFQEERFRDAVRLCDRFEKEFGKDAQIFRYRALAREMLDEDRKAEEDYKKALMEDGNDYRSMEGLAGVYERHGGRDAQARELYRMALARDPRPEWKENLKVWIAMLESRLQPEESTAVGCWNLGNEQALKGRHKEAEALYSKAIDLDPGMFQAYWSRGVARLKLGAADQALVDLQQAASLSPDFAQAYMYRGLAREALGETNKAREDFRKAATLDPRDPAALFHHARSSEKTDDPEKIVEIYSEALKRRPDPELAAEIRRHMSALGVSPGAKRSGKRPEPSENKELW